MRTALFRLAVEEGLCACEYVCVCAYVFKVAYFQVEKLWEEPLIGIVQIWESIVLFKRSVCALEEPIPN